MSELSIYNLEKIDDCAKDAQCQNNAGGYTCECNKGYSGNGFECKNINECKEGTDYCSAEAICRDLPGSFKCQCKDGFTGDGVTCSDINECQGFFQGLAFRYFGIFFFCNEKIFLSSFSFITRIYLTLFFKYFFSFKEFMAVTTTLCA